MELKQYLEIILRRKWILVVTVLVVTLTVFIINSLQKPVYQASIKIHIKEGGAAAILPGMRNLSNLSTLTRFGSALQTQMELIMTRPLLVKVIKKLDLKDEDGEYIETDSLRKNLLVSVVKLADIISVSVLSTDPKQAMDIANTLGNVYVEDNQRIGQEEARNAKEFIEGQLSKTRKELSLVESTLQKQINLPSLARTQKVAEETYVNLLEKWGEARIMEAMKVANARIVEPAELPKKPVKPNKTANTFAGLIVGIVVGLGLTFVFEYLDDSIKSADEVADLLKVPVLGTLPKIGQGWRRRKQNEDATQRLVVKDDPRSHSAEAYRILRTNLQFIKPDDPVNSLVVTSAIPEEGKSTVAANLAIVMAQTGKKVLLVDADLRKPMIHEIFKLSNERGLTSVLKGGFDISDVMLQSEIKGLSILSSGPIPPNPSELLDSKKMRESIDSIKGSFDMVIYDTPPVINVTDGVILSSRVSGVIMVVDSSVSEKQRLKRAKEVLDAGSPKILGSVLNKVAYEGRGYNYYYYQSKT